MSLIAVFGGVGERREIESRRKGGKQKECTPFSNTIKVKKLAIDLWGIWKEGNSTTGATESLEFLLLQKIFVRADYKMINQVINEIFACYYFPFYL